MTAATKGAHDWHCEHHDTYGWRGESCRRCESEQASRRELAEALCPEASFAADTERLNNLATRVLELEGRLFEMQNAAIDLAKQLDVERMRLAACSVAAMSNTPASAASARQMNPKYRSAALNDIERVVDSEMALRGLVASLRAGLEKIACLGNGDQHGNSIGNQMAIDLIRIIDAKT